MKRFVAYFSVALICLACTEPVVSTFGSIGGTVQDARTGEYMAGVTVTINPLGYSQVTNSDGAFQYDNLDVAEYTMIAAKSGYETYKQKVTVKPGMTSSVQMTLNPASTSVSTTPAILDFGSKDTQKELKISCSTGLSVPYRLSESNSWISLSKSSGIISGDDYVTVVVSREGLSPAIYDGNVFINVEDKEFSVPVKMMVQATNAPIVTVEPVSEVTSGSAVVSGTIKALGDSKVSQHGFCWSSDNQSPGLSDEFNQLGDASEVKSFSTKLTGLKPATKYYVRTYAVNTYGTSYSDQVETFTTFESSSGGGNDSSDEIAVPQGLVSYYTFDDGDASDITENELDGVLVRSPAFIEGTVDGKGLALHLNGIKEQYMSIPYNVFKNLKKLSASFWIKDFSIGVIFSAISSDHVRSDYPRLIAATNGTFRFYTGYDNYDSTQNFVYEYTPIQNSKWHHVAVIMNDDIRILYVDGVRVDSNNAFAGGGSHPCSKIFIGGNNEGKYNNDCMTMKIDNIRFYQRALSDSEIMEIYESEK